MEIVPCAKYTVLPSGMKVAATSSNGLVTIPGAKSVGLAPVSMRSFGLCPYVKVIEPRILIIRVNRLLDGAFSLYMRSYFDKFTDVSAAGAGYSTNGR